MRSSHLAEHPIARFSAVPSVFRSSSVHVCIGRDEGEEMRSGGGENELSRTDGRVA